jgi:DNA-binding XRE family transcriptional regulator
MSTAQPIRKVNLTAQQRAEHRRIRKLFENWHPSPEELIASGEGGNFVLCGEYPYLRPFLAELKQVREQAGLSLADVSRRCGVDKAALSRLENGHNPNPTLDTLWRYAAAVGRRLRLDTDVITRAAKPGSAPNTTVRKKGKVSVIRAVVKSVSTPS